MKILIRIMYGIFILFIGFMVLSDATFKRTQNFYYDSAITNLKENNLTEFVDDTLLISGASRYLIEPIYRFQSNDSQYSFNLTAYHYQKVSSKAILSGMMFYVTNFEAKEEVDGLSLVFISNISNQFAEYIIEFNIDEEYAGGNVLNPIIIVYNETNEFNLNDYNNATIKLAEIKEIQLKTFVYENDERIISDNHFAVIKHNDQFKLEFGNESQFERKGSVLEINNFTGNPSEYKFLDDNYAIENSHKIPDLEKIAPYNKLISRSLLIYLGVSILSTYLLFFLKPTINKIKSFKNKKNEAEIID